MLKENVKMKNEIETKLREHYNILKKDNSSDSDKNVK